jgi:glucose-1-phosphate thymidylyltransferase
LDAGWPRPGSCSALSARAWAASSHHSSLPGAAQARLRAARCSGVKLCGLIVVEDAARNRLRNGHVHVQALEEVANRPIVEHVLDDLERAGAREVMVASSAALSGDIEERLDACAVRDRVAVRYLRQPDPLELSDALRLAAQAVGEQPCIVHRATGLLDEPLAPLADRLGDAPDVVVVADQARGRDSRDKPKEVADLAERRARRAPAMAGVWLFGPGALPVTLASGSCLAGDGDLMALAERLDAAGGALQVRLADSWRQYGGDPLDLLELNRIVLDRLEPGLRRPADDGNQIEGRVSIHSSASVHSSVIVGPTVIGPCARITDAYIGPYTSIGERARVEGAEIERSIISAGASVTHVGGRLVASVVGRDARVFRDFSLPRALRLRVGAGTEVALC